MKKWQDDNPSRFVNEPLDPSLLHKPKYTSVKQIKNENHVNARDKCRLLSYENEIKVEKLPTLAFIDNPKHKVYADIKNDLKNENLQQSIKLTQQQRKSLFLNQMMLKD